MAGGSGSRGRDVIGVLGDDPPAGRSGLQSAAVELWAFRMGNANSNKVFSILVSAQVKT